MNQVLQIEPELHRSLTEKSDFRAFLTLATSYFLIAAGAGVALWSGPMQIPRYGLALVLFGSAQIGLAV